MFGVMQIEEMSHYVEWLYQYTQYPLHQCKLMFAIRYPGYGWMFDQLVSEWLD